MEFNSKKILLTFAGIGSAFSVVQSERPNVVIFFTDDQGYGDVNRYGGIDLLTPNMDKICDEGVMFTQFYANSSVSSPSRASLLTGKYPQNAGVPNIVSSEQGIAGMPASEVTIAEVLKHAGYSTALIGKWHLGYSKETMPENQGFDHSFGHMGGCIDNYSHYFYWYGPNRHDLWQDGKEIWRSGENFSNLMVTEAVNFIDEHKDKPFFLYFSSNYPHYPLQGDQKWLEYYQSHHVPHPRDKYAAMVSTIDEKIGIVMDKLEKEGLKNNTIIIFMSDNGYSTEERTFSGGGSAGKLRGAKFSCFEGGIRVPAVIAYPRLIPHHQVRDQVAMGTDWFPTILDLCDIRYNKDEIDGKSLLPVIKSKNEKSAHHVINWQVDQSWAVRKGNYKLVHNNSAKEKVYALYDIFVNPEETDNLLEEKPDVVNDLLRERENWLQGNKR